VGGVDGLSVGIDDGGVLDNALGLSVGKLDGRGVG
jgi:hypothetical protein